MRSQPIQRPSLSFQTRRRCSKRKRGPAGRGAVTSIEAFNAVACDSDQFRIAFRSIDVRIDPIRQQSKVQIAFRARQMVDLEPLHLLRDVFGRRQKRRHGDKRAQRFRELRREGRGPATEPREREA